MVDAHRVPTAQLAPGPAVVARGALRGLPGRLGYLLAGVPLGLVAFVVAVVGFCLGVATAVVGVGLPVLAVTLRAARGLAVVERRSTERVTGRALPPHRYRVAVPGAGGLTRSLAMLRDPQAWRDLLHAVLGLPVRLAAGVIALVWGVAGLGGLGYVVWEWSLPDEGRAGLVGLLTGRDSPSAEILLVSALGALVLLAAPWLARALVAARAALTRGLLTNQTAALRARAEELAESRQAAVAAEASTLRRLERDIHDGPQQRLVRMAMDLETASRRLDDDPARARPLLEEVIAQNREALAELRALSRGIAPPVLADRGLGAALAAAAARSPVPVALDVTVPDRLPAPVENAAYFIVAEALTNVAKHAGARAAAVTAAVDGDRLRVAVHDDGRGGAHPGRGHGLAGLGDRVAAVDGTFAISSPDGGPTVLTASLPAGRP